MNEKFSDCRTDPSTKKDITIRQSFWREEEGIENLGKGCATVDDHRGYRDQDVGHGKNRPCSRYSFNGRFKRFSCKNFTVYSALLRKILNPVLNRFQAVVCIGGDGTLAEVINGLVLRTSKEQQIDPNDPEVSLPTPLLPIGVIPSGSTDTVAYSLHGTTDVQTAAIHIIFGDSTGLDISSVHSEQTLLRLYASVLSYGYLGDVIRDSEKFRWMGPQRYDYSGESIALGTWATFIS